MLIPVLMYHDIRPDDYRIPAEVVENAPYVLMESAFRRQTEFIASNGIVTMNIRDLGQMEAENGRPPEGGRRNAVVLSFDDGAASNYERAFKVLLALSMKGTFFITTDFVERQGYVSWQQLREIQAAGMEIGSHSVSHPVASLLTDAQLSYELSKSKEVLEDRLGCAVESFSLPRGFDHPCLEYLAREAGYTAICNSRPGLVNTRAFRPFDINRIAVRRTTGLDEFCRYVCCSRSLMQKRVAKEKLLRGAKALLGVERYDRMRKSILRRTYGYPENVNKGG